MKLTSESQILLAEVCKDEKPEQLAKKFIANDRRHVVQDAWEINTHALAEWPQAKGIALNHIQQRKPTLNA